MATGHSSEASSGAHATDHSAYYVPAPSPFAIWAALGIGTTMGGLGLWLNSIKAGGGTNPYVFASGFLILATVLFVWFGTVIRENHAGMTNAQVKRSFIWGMAWFIFSEVMFFAAFFGALFYARELIVPWLGGTGEKGITGSYLWPEFAKAYQAHGWPMLQNPDPTKFTAPHESMHAGPLSTWGSYIPFWNTLILVGSSVTVHFSHNGIKDGKRPVAIGWLAITVAMGILFVSLQAYEYMEAYADKGLTLASGIYGSTFFILTGFHGFHVTLGAFILGVQLLRMMRGHFGAHDQFGLEAGSWYWHFVDVVWICLFMFVYVL